LSALLALSRQIDRLSRASGWLAEWMVLAACAIAAGNAAIRYGFSVSSNAWLEMQWYLFAGVVMLGASWTLLRNQHVRVDLVYGALARRTRLWVDVFGLAVFLLPGMALLAWMTVPFFLDSFWRMEGSASPGGLLRWPVKILMPIGFALMVLQGISELIKRIAILRGEVADPEIVAEYEKPLQ
jgi:TRAP-type mannitol/chloroaromatic compound transport system permease small subunit